MIVIDASAIVEVLLRRPAGVIVENRLRSNAQIVVAPHVIDLEIASALRRLLFKREIDAGRGEVALEDFAQIPIVRWPHASLLPRIWELRDNVTAYDAAYVALAEALDAPLLTCDRRLAAVAGHRARIEAV